MEELIKAAEAVLRLKEDLDDATLVLRAARCDAFNYVHRMFGNDIPNTFVYTSDAGDNYLVTVDIEDGEILSVWPVPVLHQRDAAIHDYHTIVQAAE